MRTVMLQPVYDLHRIRSISIHVKFDWKHTFYYLKQHQILNGRNSRWPRLTLHSRNAAVTCAATEVFPLYAYQEDRSLETIQITEFGETQNGAPYAWFSGRELCVRHLSVMRVR
jgi:hypothetical protein